MEAPAIAKRH